MAEFQPDPAVEPPTRTPDLLEQVYRDHAAYLHRALGRLGVPPEHVDDALHDLFLVVHRRLPEFEGRASLRTWLFGIAIRIARKQRDAVARRPDSLGLGLGLVHAGDGPEEALARQRSVALLDRLLATLDDERRELVVLIEIEGLSVVDAAELLGLKLNTAYSRLRLARRDLDRALADLRASQARSET